MYESFYNVDGSMFLNWIMFSYDKIDEKIFFLFFKHFYLAKTIIEVLIGLSVLVLIKRVTEKPFGSFLLKIYLPFCVIINTDVFIGRRYSILIMFITLIILNEKLIGEQIFTSFQLNTKSLHFACLACLVVSSLVLAYVPYGAWFLLAFVEELVFRVGLFQLRFKSEMGYATISSLFFALIHYKTGIFPGAFIGGYLLAKLWIRYENITLNAAIHTAINIVYMVVVMLIREQCIIA